MKMMQGLFCLACSNRSRTREAPTPTNISTKSEPEIEKERHPGLAGDGAREQRLAGARRSVQQHPRGDPRAERLELLGVLRNSLISCSSSTASSTPATSRKVILGESADMRLARDLPNDITFEPPP